jgi:hypothetical protein
MSYPNHTEYVLSEILKYIVKIKEGLPRLFEIPGVEDHLKSVLVRECTSRLDSIWKDGYEDVDVFNVSFKIVKALKGYVFDEMRDESEECFMKVHDIDLICEALDEIINSAVIEFGEPTLSDTKPYFNYCP